MQAKRPLSLSLSKALRDRAADGVARGPMSGQAFDKLRLSGRGVSPLQAG